MTGAPGMRKRQAGAIPGSGCFRGPPVQRWGRRAPQARLGSV